MHIFGLPLYFVCCEPLEALKPDSQLFVLEKCIDYPIFEPMILTHYICLLSSLSKCRDNVIANIWIGIGCKHGEMDQKNALVS